MISEDLLQEALFLGSVYYTQLLYLGELLLWLRSSVDRTVPPCAFISSMCLFKEVNLALAWSFSFFILLSAFSFFLSENNDGKYTNVYSSLIQYITKVILSRHHLTVWENQILYYSKSEKLKLLSCLSFIKCLARKGNGTCRTSSFCCNSASFCPNDFF